MRHKVTYMNTAAYTPVQAQEAPQKPEPMPYHSLTVGVWLPLAQAVVTALVLAIAAAGIALLADAGIASLKWAGGTFCIVLAGMWLMRQAAWTNTVKRLESMIGMDLNGDGYIEPDVERVEVNLNYRREDGTLDVQKRRQYSAGATQMAELANGILTMGKPFTEDALAVGRGKIFSQPQLTQLRREFLEDKLIETKGIGEKSGYVFTAEGLEFLRHFLPHS